MRRLLAAAIAFLPLVGAHAAPAASMQLATQPECYIVGDEVMVRGAVVDKDTGAPIPDARVQFAYGNQRVSGRTRNDGVYIAFAPASSKASEVHELGAWVRQAGMNLYYPARAFETHPAVCKTAMVSVGEPQSMK